jgi:ribosomal protein S18 acetylase RimI-like enzyme
VRINYQCYTLQHESTQPTLILKGTSLHLRTATPNDSINIANIHTLSWRATYQQALSAEYLADRVPDERKQLWAQRLTKPASNQHVMVAEVDEQVVGFVCLSFNENPKWGTYLDNLHVRAGFQGLGIGKALLQAAAQCSNQQSPNLGMCLLVNQDNVKAQSFYLKLGARNAEASIWHAPDGTDVPTFWFVWDQLTPLL